MRAAGARVVNVDRGAAEGVGVGVGAVVHNAGGEGDDGGGGGGGVAAGTEAWVGVNLGGEGRCGRVRAYRCRSRSWCRSRLWPSEREGEGLGRALASSWLRE